MPMTQSEKKKCEKCGRIMIKKTNFYQSKDLENHPDGYMDECKLCYTMHLKLDDPATILPLLEKMDVPYIESEWKILVDRYDGDLKKGKTTPTAIFGRYIAKMKLSQYKNLRYADTETYMSKDEHQAIVTKISQNEHIEAFKEAVKSGEDIKGLESILTPAEIAQLRQDTQAIMEQNRDPDAEYADFTERDRQYLRNKWGLTYTISDCVKLEKLYLEMMESYDIRTASHLDYLLKICRISLKIDQALDVGNIEDYQKMTKIYDLLMKSAKFTAAQGKDQDDDYTDSVGVLVGLAEEKGFIPQYHDEERQDIVDLTLKDMNSYTEKLVKSELNLGNMIEVYLQKMQQEETKDEDEMTDEDDDIVILNEKEEEMIKDSDYNEFNDMIDEEIELDEELLSKSGESL